MNREGYVSRDQAHEQGGGMCPETRLMNREGVCVQRPGS